MRRGDIVTVAVSGDYGKPRPAVIVQSDTFPTAHPSVIVCQLTSDRRHAEKFRPYFLFIRVSVMNEHDDLALATAIWTSQPRAWARIDPAIAKT